MGELTELPFWRSAYKVRIFQMTSSEDVRSYYDDFTHTRFATYAPGSNIRIEMAINRILNLANPGMRILEIGCGIGIVTERLHDCIPNVHIWACDTSQAAINVAKSRLQSDRLDFRQFDVVNDFDSIDSWVDEKVDLVILVDVIEHIPADSHQSLLQNLKSQLRDDGNILLTYPSAQYQTYIKAEDPDELQIIDETITAQDIVHASNSAGMVLTHYSLETAWRTNQYVHCILSATAPLDIRDSRSDRSKAAVTQLRINFANSRALSGFYAKKLGGKIKRLFRSGT